MITHIGSALSAPPTRETARSPAPQSEVSQPEVSQRSGAEKTTAGSGKELPADGEKRSPGPVDFAAEVAEAVGQLNDYVQNIQRDLHFSIDDDTGRTVIKVVDSQSEEVIRQIPPEEALVLARHLEQLSEGAIMREEA